MFNFFLSSITNQTWEINTIYEKTHKTIKEKIKNILINFFLIIFYFFVLLILNTVFYEKKNPYFNFY